MMFAAAFSVQPLPQADGPLEPSVQNEVDHAIDRGEKWLEKGPRPPQKLKDSKSLKVQLGLTNGQSRAEVALKLVSTQKGDGWWLTETNAAPTRLAIEILKGL